jgi:nuclear pore complex protein Nup98-Nup96
LFEDTAQPVTPDFFVARQSIKKLNIDTTDDDEEDRLLQSKKKDLQDAKTPTREVSILATTPAKSPSITEPDVLIKPKPHRLSKTDGFSEMPKLTKDGYYTAPSVDSLATMSSEQLSAVSRFTVGRKGIGNVLFLEPTDVRGLDIDNIVEFEPGEIVVYPDEHYKPPVGRGLNKPARVTLQKLFPLDKATGRRKVDDASLARYEAKIRKSTQKLGARFISYDRTTGDWIFEVEHFSRYGLLDDSDEEDDEPVPPQNGIKPQAIIPPQSPSKRFRIEESESEDSTEGSNHDEEELEAEVRLLI